VIRKNGRIPRKNSKEEKRKELISGIKAVALTGGALGLGYMIRKKVKSVNAAKNVANEVAKEARREAKFEARRLKREAAKAVKKAAANVKSVRKGNG